MTQQTPAISGRKVSRPSKRDLVRELARELDLPEPNVSDGGSVEAPFLTAIYAKLAGSPVSGLNTYESCSAVLAHLGLSYDPYWDTSEAADNGGGTVSTRAFSRILAAVRHEPRCFILNVTDAPVGARWETEHSNEYAFDQTVTGRLSLLDAGPGSQVLYYSTSKSSSNKMRFVATAVVRAVVPRYHADEWKALLTDYQTLAWPVRSDQVEVIGWNRQHAITEIEPALFRSIVQLGGGAMSDTTAADLGADETVDHVVLDHDDDSRRIPPIVVPDLPPAGPIVPADMSTPAFGPGRAATASSGPYVPSRYGPTELNRKAEQRAIRWATLGLHHAGWTLTRDRQADGVGYDLEFRGVGGELHVEVKGIRGPLLTFNVTPKEFHTAQNDPHWILVAVLNVSGVEPEVRVLTRDEVLQAPRSILGYRVAPQQ